MIVMQDSVFETWQCEVHGNSSNIMKFTVA